MARKSKSAPDAHFNLNVRGYRQPASLDINEHGAQLAHKDKTIYRPGPGRSPFPLPQVVVGEFRANAYQEDNCRQVAFVPCGRVFAIILSMCGRFAQIHSERYAELFGVSGELSAIPRYNIAPTQHILACRVNAAGVKELAELYWGLVPAWSKGPDKRYSMINARAETIAEKPAYRTPFRKHRCLIPADGFYEWKPGNGKQPYYIHRKDDEPLVFAGIWEHWQDDTGDKLDSCAIIVCEANREMRLVHERMPVILTRDMWDQWLMEEDVNVLQAMLGPYRMHDLDIYPVSKAVNNPKNDGEQLITRV